MRHVRWFLMLTAAAGLFALSAAPLALAQCDCPFQGDMNDDHILDAIDDGFIIEYLFFGHGPNLQDPTCPTSRDDLNADGFVDIVDLEILYDILFTGASPADPCVCGFPCARLEGDGAGSVVIESKTVWVGTQNTVGVFLTNTSTLGGLVIPLVVREIDTYPTALSFKLRSDGRLLSEFAPPLKILGAYDLLDGDCAGGPGTGFTGPVATASSAPYQVTLPSVSSPDAFQCALGSIALVGAATLSPGSDVVPSLEISFTAPGTPGMFEIDTTCSNPANHLAFYEATTHGEITPSFTKGTITVALCDCPYQGDFDGDNVIDAIDLNDMINALFFGGPDPQDIVCPTTRADFNNDNAADALDLNLLIEHMFFGGGGPCDPCNPVQSTCVP